MKKGKLKHIHIETAKNGFIVKATHDRDLGGSDQVPIAEPEQDVSIHSTASSLAKHVGKLAEAHSGSAASDDDPDDFMDAIKATRSTGGH